MTIGSDTCFST